MKSAPLRLACIGKVSTELNKVLHGMEMVVVGLCTMKCEVILTLFMSKPPSSGVLSSLGSTRFRQGTVKG